MKQGIIDPAKVTKSALENAVSIAGLLLTTGGAIVVDDTPASGAPNPLHALLGG
jgi:chaperonin GroEL